MPICAICGRIKTPFAWQNLFSPDIRRRFNYPRKSMHVLNGKTFICNKNGLFTFTIKRTNHDKEFTPTYPQQVSPPLLANPRLHRPQARTWTGRPSLILRNTIKTKFYINFALMNCGTFHAIFISFIKVTGLKP